MCVRERECVGFKWCGSEELYHLRTHTGMERLCLLLVVLHITAGCMLSDNTTMEVKGHTVGSVLLSCSCTDLQTRPQSLIWRTLSSGNWTDVFRDERYRDRVQGFNKTSPGNLSLLITDLREEDGGDYRCESEHKYYRDLTLRVSVRETGTHSWTSRTSPEVSHTVTVTSGVKEGSNNQTGVHLSLVLSIPIPLLLVLLVLALICWRHRGQRNRQNVATVRHVDVGGEQDDQTGSDVIYSTIDDRNIVPSAHVQISTRAKTEYATLSLTQPRPM
ncbi:uncharacterized protein LOC143522621 [Brachyhypopomus gauderio]|uniref:uncharacterized protein LOC143522621 n=1 Tax=Brachyhypopomus gauderio TaxID=698409 RepID=UPI0040419162